MIHGASGNPYINMLGYVGMGTGISLKAGQQVAF